MLSKVNTAIISGIDAVMVRMETDISKGLPAFHIVGTADTTVKEARERIRSAIRHSGMEYPMGRIVINMAPANQRKRGSQLDLPMALGILAGSGQILTEGLRDYGLLGELSLDGSIQRVNGILPMVAGLFRQGCTHVIVPKGNQDEAALVKGICVHPVETLREVTDHFNRRTIIPEYTGRALGTEAGPVSAELDYADVKGQESAKRALLVAAAGGHGVLMTGSPATGKTMLAERIPTILPPLTYEEQMEVTMIYSVSGLLDQEHPLILHRPFRSPHHTITSAALIGGGGRPIPGEITLADKGVLFLDELAEFPAAVIDTLRQPLEKKEVNVSRSRETCTYPADFLLVAATNPCKCGYYGEDDGTCQCTLTQVRQYQARISGPVLDRIDIHLFLKTVPYGQLNSQESMSSSAMREQVIRAREIQSERFRDMGILLNSQMSSQQIREMIEIHPDGEELLAKAYEKHRLNPRTLDKTRRIARTIADLDGKRYVEMEHVAEALQYQKREV